MIEDKVVLEFKAGTAIDPAFEAQLINRLRATELEVGLLLNFGRKATFKRFISTNDTKSFRSSA